MGLVRSPMHSDLCAYVLIHIMHQIILTLFIACSSAAKLNGAYLPPNYAQTSGGSSDFLQTPLSSPTSNFNEFSGQRNDGFPSKDILAHNKYAQDANDFIENSNGILQSQINAFGNYGTRPERPRAALERNAATLRQFNNNNGETFSYAFETENGIHAEENGVATNGVEAQGGYSYTADDGQVYSVKYTAGQNGFVPEGDHLPTPPPIPEEILLALEQNARDEAAGIYDDGSYDEYNGDNRYETSIFGDSNANGKNVNKINDDDSVVINTAFNSEVFRQQGTRIILTVFIACSKAAKLNGAYLPPNYAQTSGGSSDFLQTPHSSPTSNFNEYSGKRNDGFPSKDILAHNKYYQDGNDFIENSKGILQSQINAFENYETRPERPRATLERNAAILRQFNNNDGETFSYAFETENGINAEENGVATNGVEAQGSYSYTGDDGQVYSVRYTAGQNGFVPEGDHLPTPPPIPEEILLALEQNARDEAAGIYDDGSYDEYKYSNRDNRYETPIFGNSNANGNNVNKINDDDSVVVNSAFNSQVFRQQGTGVRNTIQPVDSGVTKAYLPPTSEQRTSGNQNGGARFGNRNRQSSFTHRNGYNY
ncbi:unnamed protein product [Parnassius mnemosyne]|uniref:Uncharacterized protein n=1 Tax=Parnassius mnemosyne TaxID=213953 RepID=A0AAV1KMC5_9NEOP